MLWRGGQLLNTLRYHIKKNIRESIQDNEILTENEWNVHERNILCWSHKPLNYTIKCFVAYILNCIALLLWLKEIRTIAGPWQSWIDFLQWEQSIFSSQITIIGVIFPLVIGFVGVLLQNKSANRALWQIYSRYSGFMFTGLNGLMLASIIGLWQLFKPWLDHQHEVAFSIGAMFWLLFNISLITWFVYSTFNFMAISRRNKLLLRFSINDYLKSEITARLAQQLPHRAFEIGLLSTKKKYEPEIELCTIRFSDKGLFNHDVSFKKPKYLCNIYFLPLNYAVKMWVAKHRKNKNNQVSGKLILPVYGGTQPEKKWCLIASTDKNIGWLIWRIVKFSYKFSSEPFHEISIIGDVIQALFGNVNDALKDQNIKLYGQSLTDLKKLHATLLSGASFVNDDGQEDNWLLLPEGFFFSRTLSTDFSREYSYITQPVLQLIPQSTEYFHKLCYVFINIHGYDNSTMAQGIARELIYCHYRLWIALMKWRGYSDDSSAESVVAKQYDDAIRIFVGSWEHWTSTLKYKGSEEQDWQSTPILLSSKLTHLECTARLLVSSIRHHEQKAARWAADMIVNWYGHPHPSSSVHQFWWKSTFITHTMLGTEIESAFWSWVLDNDNFNQRDAVSIALKNAWIDVRITLAAYLLNRPQDSFTDSFTYLVNALVDGERLMPSGSIDISQRPIETGAGVLETYIRQLSPWEDGEKIYPGWIERFIESLGQIEESETVVGRIYSGWGGRDIRSLKKAYIIIAISKSKKTWKLSASAMGFLKSDLLELYEREIINRELEEWRKAADDLDEDVKRFMGDSYEEGYLINFKNSVNVVINDLKELNIQVVQEAEIDAQRLKQFGRFSSETGFTKDNGQLPIILFDTVNFVNDLEAKYAFKKKITNFDRSEVAKGVEINRAINEADWYDKVITDSVSMDLFGRFIKTFEFEEQLFENNRHLIERVVTDAKRLKQQNQTPIFFIGPWSIYDLLDSSLWAEGQKEEQLPFSIHRADGYPSSYVCHVEEFIAYRAPINNLDYSILTVEENFQSLTVRMIDEEQYVEVDFIEDADDKLKGTLELTYWLKTEFERYPAFKYKELGRN